MDDYEFEGYKTVNGALAEVYKSDNKLYAQYVFDFMDNSKRIASLADIPNDIYLYKYMSDNGTIFLKGLIKESDSNKKVKWSAIDSDGNNIAITDIDKVCIFLGTIDTNGNPIYTNDIVRVKNYCGAVKSYLGNDISLCAPKGALETSSPNSCSVIGNKYDTDSFSKLYSMIEDISNQL